MTNKELVQIAMKAANEWRGTDGYHQAATIIDMLVSELTVTKYGKWIQEYVPNADPHERTRYKCSLCGRREDFKEPFCNCGAKMN